MKKRKFKIAYKIGEAKEDTIRVHDSIAMVLHLVEIVLSVDGVITSIKQINE